MPNPSRPTPDRVWKCESCGGTFPLDHGHICKPTPDQAEDQVRWYVRCLEDIQDGRPVRGLAEAKAGYDAALSELVARFAASEAARGQAEQERDGLRREWGAAARAAGERIAGLEEDRDRLAAAELTPYEANELLDLIEKHGKPNIGTGIIVEKLEKIAREALNPGGVAQAPQEQP